MAKRTEHPAAERVVVIGLGRFGTSTARTLHELGFEVTAIDLGERQVAEATAFATLAAQGDGTDEELLRSLAVDRSHYGVVAQTESLEASALATLLLKRLGVPWVVAKAGSLLHGELLRRVGADRIVFPERDAGVRLDRGGGRLRCARRLGSGRACRRGGRASGGRPWRRCGARGRRLGRALRGRVGR